MQDEMGIRSSKVHVELGQDWLNPHVPVQVIEDGVEHARTRARERIRRIWGAVRDVSVDVDDGKEKGKGKRARGPAGEGVYELVQRGPQLIIRVNYIKPYLVPRGLSTVSKRSCVQ